jgi:hypothetical protein
MPIDRAEMLRAMHRLDVFYRAWNGLQRPNGLSLGGRPDFEGIAAWILDVYLNDRLGGRSQEQAWDHVVAAIQGTVEWQSKDRLPVDAVSLTGKHLLGYQGWFGTPQDGQGAGWDHWFRGEPIAANLNFDLWPDLREYFPSELAPTRLTWRPGERAGLYSCHTPRTLRRHFDWMADAGIDGVSLGRFSKGTLDAASRARLDHLAMALREAADAAGRVFFLWYDATGHPRASFVDDMKRDWRHVKEVLGLTDSGRYLYHRGKPLVGLWGAGAEDRPFTPEQWREVITFLRSEATVLLGGARNWRVDPTWAPVFATVDAISPWAIGAFGDTAGADEYRRTVTEPDLALTSQRGQDYLPTLFPGFSWHNLQGGQAPINSTPRRGGRFYWRQVFNAIDAGASMLFTAMFDEVDEGTAMFKVAETQRDVPQEGTFLSLDADGEPLPSDWYLRLAGAATRVLRGQIPLGPAIPITP